MSLVVEEIFGTLKVVSPPVPGLRQFGVPPGGPFDAESHSLANALLGRGAECPSIELSLGSMVVKASDPSTFAWVGAGASQSAIDLSVGEKFRFDLPAEGCRSYLAVGSIPSPSLSRGDRIDAPRLLGSRIRLRGAPSSLESGTIPVLRGPESDRLPFERLMNSSFTVSHYLNRIGIRLHSENQNEFAHSLELPSEPSHVGVVQITPNGEAILIGPDGPTIGGYPRIAIVPFFAIGFVAQLKPSDQVHFHEISLQEAVAARKNWTARITKYAGLIQTLAAVQT